MRFITVHPISIFGLFDISPFGILVLTGVLIGIYMTNQRGKQLGLRPDQTYDMVFWTLLPGFIASHVLDVIFYSNSPIWPERLYELIDIRGRLSSMGGFLGAIFGLIAWCKRNKKSILPFADSLAFGLAFGWIFGRLGCFLVHDHPGKPTTFFLGVDYPDTRRHDLGFYEVLFALAMSLIFYINFKLNKKLRAGLYVGILATSYGIVRFFLDFLRIDTKDALAQYRDTDPRYLIGLTPAQFAAFLVFAAGLWTLKNFLRTEQPPTKQPFKPKIAKNSN